MSAVFKLLVVEDEVGIAHLIKNSIDFEKLSLELAGHAKNGKEGLALIRQHRPDIVITDIYMPVMNGVDMITEASKDNLDTQFIIISGLTQFKYAMSALNAGVCGYLLKPLNKQELNILLEKTIQKIARSRKIEYQMSIMESVLDSQKREKRGAFIFNMLHFRERLVERDANALNAEYGFNFKDEGSAYTIGVLLLDGVRQLNYSASKTIIEQLSTQALVDMSGVCHDMEVYERGDGFVILCNYSEKNAIEFKGLLINEFSLIRQKLESDTEVSVSMACGAPVKNVAGIIDSLDSALSALSARVILGTGKLLDAAKLVAMKPSKAARLTEREATALVSAVDIKNAAKVCAVLNEIYTAAVRYAQNYPCYVFDALSDLTFDIASLLYRRNITDRLTNKANSLYRNTASQMSSAADLIKYSVDYVMGLMPDFSDKGSGESETAANIRKYIDEHLSEPLKLEDVAAEFYLSPSYFGTVFKNEIGESFSSYLQSVRINRAKELLSGTNDTVDMIAGKCGYLDRKHFSRLFAGVVGVKPNEYRKLNR